MNFPQDDSLNKLQEYLRKELSQRGFDDETLSEKIMLLAEEVGELARGVRKHTNSKMSTTTKQSEAAEEAADVLIVLIDICNKLGINLFDAVQEKEKINQNRTWH